MQDWLLVRIHKTDRTAGGLHLPEEAAKELQPYVEVVALGPGIPGPTGFIETPFKRGDFLMPRPTVAMQQLTVKGEALHLVRSVDITGRVTP